jgi:hypothetical protein
VGGRRGERREGREERGEKRGKRRETQEPALARGAEAHRLKPMLLEEGADLKFGHYTRRIRVGREGWLEVGVGGEAVIDAGGRLAERGGGVAFGEPGREFGAEARLMLDEFVVSCFGEMDLSGARRRGSEVTYGSNHAGRVQIPFHEQTIGGNATMKRAGGDAIKIRNVPAGYAAEAIEIEMSIFGFERIKSPLDETNVAAESVFPLGEFELAADAAVAISRKNGSHVRVEVRSVIVKADVGLGEADHGVAVEGAEDLAAGVMRDDVGDVGFGVEVGVGPDVPGDLHAKFEFGDGVERADGDGGHEFSGEVG